MTDFYGYLRFSATVSKKMLEADWPILVKKEEEIQWSGGKKESLKLTETNLGENIHKDYWEVAWQIKMAAN